MPNLTNRSKVIVTSVLLVALGGLAAADYYYGDGNYAGNVTGDGSSSQASVPAGGVAKNNGPVVEDVIADEKLTTATSNDLTLLHQVAADGSEVQSFVLLQDGDRAGSVAWVQSPNVKIMFMGLKEALLPSFSSQVQDLRDETVQDGTQPVRNILTFLDPSLSVERVVFVRVRERLYEFHIVEEKKEVMNSLIQALTTK